MTATVMPTPQFQGLDDDGHPVAAGLLYTYEAGTSTPLDTFTTSTLTLGTENANPIELSAAGRAVVYLQPQAYKFVLKTAAGATIYSQDNVLPSADGAEIAAALVDIAAAQADIAAAETDIAALETDVAAAEADIVALEAIPVDTAQCQGRITLTAGTAVTTADVTAATSVRFTPYQGNRIALYSGTAWVLRTFAELSLSLGSDAANLPYDLFVYDNAGTAALERTAWTNGTTRATALTLQDGVLVKTGATTRRYVGTYLTTSAVGETEDSVTKRYVWNYYHRAPKTLRVADATASWVYSTATYRQANAAAGNQVAIVNGFLDGLIELDAFHQFANDNANVEVMTAIGENSTSAATAGTMGQSAYSTVVNIKVNVSAVLKKFPAVGYSYYAWLEKATATGTTTFYGASGAHIGGLLGTWRC